MSALLASMRDRVLHLRMNLQEVLTVLNVRVLSLNEDEAKQLARGALTSITGAVPVADDGVVQAEKLEAEMLALRQDVAIVMAKLFLAVGRSVQEVEAIILSPLGLKVVGQSDSNAKGK